jgi:aspartate racemase
MGPGATVDFMATLLALTPASADQDHVHMLVDNNPGIPGRQEAILRGGPSPAPALADMARRLQAAGADFLVMPCNTAHAWRADIQSAVDIPLVSIVDATVAACRDYKSVGLLATAGCLRSRIYQEAAGAAGIELVLTTDAELDEFMELMFRIKQGDTSETIAASILQLADALAGRGAEAIIAGCTEIPLALKHESPGMPLVSSTDELAKETIALALGNTALNSKESRGA